MYLVLNIFMVLVFKYEYIFKLSIYNIYASIKYIHIFYVENSNIRRTVFLEERHSGNFSWKQNSHKIFKSSWIIFLKLKTRIKFGNCFKVDIVLIKSYNA